MALRNFIKWVVVMVRDAQLALIPMQEITPEAGGRG
jgi:hypothetical protein